MPPISFSNSALVVGSAPAVVISRPLPPTIAIAPPLVLMLVVVVVFIFVRIIREERLIFLGIADDDVLDDLPEQPGRHDCASQIMLASTWIVLFR